MQPYLLRLAAGKRPEEHLSDGKRPSARAQLENLDEDTLAQLLVLLAQTKKGGAPAS